MTASSSPTSPGLPAVTAWSATGTFTVPSTPPTVGSLTAATTSPSNGAPEVMFLQLNTPAQAGGAVVTLTSSNPAAAPIQASYTMGDGLRLGGVPVHDRGGLRAHAGNPDRFDQRHFGFGHYHRAAAHFTITHLLAACCRRLRRLGPGAPVRRGAERRHGSQPVEQQPGGGQRARHGGGPAG